MTIADLLAHRLIVVLVVSAIASGVAFVAYGLDKRAARRGARRVPENTLHLWSILGGWPGALVAQRMFRHKTRKVSFQIVFWVSVILNCGAVAWLLSPAGEQFPRTLFETGKPVQGVAVGSPSG